MRPGFSWRVSRTAGVYPSQSQLSLFFTYLLSPPDPEPETLNLGTVVASISLSIHLLPKSPLGVLKQITRFEVRGKRYDCKYPGEP